MFKIFLKLKEINYSLYRFIKHFLLISQIIDKVNEYTGMLITYNKLVLSSQFTRSFASGLCNWGMDYHYHRELYTHCSLWSRKALLICVVILLKCQFKLLKTSQKYFCLMRYKSKTWYMMLHCHQKGSFFICTTKGLLLRVKQPSTRDDWIPEGKFKW